MNKLITVLIQRKEALFQALIEHLEISLWALVIAILIAIPMAIWVRKHKLMASVSLQVVGVLQTIPSLALLGLLIPLVGIGKIPAIIALVVYGLLPIFQNTYTGLTEIDSSIVEAADAMGMNYRQKLFKVELPMAMPMIISGIRTSLVMIIGTATLAALIGAGGLGEFILLGIDRNNYALTIIGALGAALLAISMSFLINRLKKLTYRKLLWGLGAFVMIIGGIMVSQIIPSNKQPIVIAGKLGSEPEILINMYKAIIQEDNPDTKVVLKPNFGKTTFLFSALKNQQIDIYPEFTGTVVESLVKTPPVDAKQSVYQVAKQALKEQGLTYLKPMRYNNTYALATTKRFANQHQLATISDLKKVTAQVRAGMTLEFIDRPDGLKKIKQEYGLNLKARGMEPQLRYQAIKNGQVNVVDAYATDSQLRQYQLVVLKDNRHSFKTYRGAPLMTSKFYRSHHQIAQSLNKLANQISDSQMRQMNYQVNVLGQTPKYVARTYLLKQGLIKGAD